MKKESFCAIVAKRVEARENTPFDAADMTRELGLLSEGQTSLEVSQATSRVSNCLSAIIKSGALEVVCTTGRRFTYLKMNQNKGG